MTWYANIFDYLTFVNYYDQWAIKLLRYIYQVQNHLNAKFQLRLGLWRSNYITFELGWLAPNILNLYSNNHCALIQVKSKKDTEVASYIFSCFSIHQFNMRMIDQIYRKIKDAYKLLLWNASFHLFNFCVRQNSAEENVHWTINYCELFSKQHQTQLHVLRFACHGQTHRVCYGGVLDRFPNCCCQTTMIKALLLWKFELHCALMQWFPVPYKASIFLDGFRLKKSATTTAVIYVPAVEKMKNPIILYLSEDLATLASCFVQ